MSSFSLDGLAIRANKNGGHQTKRTIALSNYIGLDVTVVVFASPDEATRALQALSNHVVNQTMFVPDSKFLEFWFVLPLHNVGPN